MEKQPLKTSKDAGLVILGVAGELLVGKGIDKIMKVDEQPQRNSR